MKTKYKSYGVVEATLANYVQDKFNISPFDKKFVLEFARNNNMDDEHDAIEIITNETELCWFVYRVITCHKQFLEANGYQITKVR